MKRKAAVLDANGVITSKWCSGCPDGGAYQTADKFNSDKSKKGGLSSFCKPCTKACGLRFAAKKAAEKAAGIMIVKHVCAEGHNMCNQCKVEKPTEDFYASKARKSGVSGICKTCDNANCKTRREINEAEFVAKGSIIPDEKKCTRCKKEQASTEFSKHTGSKDNLHHWCRSCFTEINKARDATLDGALRKLMNNSREHIRVKNATGAEKQGLKWIDFEHTITIDDLHAIWTEQDGRCKLSTMKMSLQPHSNWHVSLERIDNRLGYIVGNICLICLEFNTAKQWNAEHIKYAASQCSDEDVVEPVDDNWKARLHKIHSNACKNASRRARKGRNMGSMTLTEEDMTAMYIQQQGRCFYSGIKLEHSGDWMVSLERLDPSITYTRDNCCLICVRFNSIDHRASLVGETDAQGANWSKGKFQYFCNEYTSSELMKQMHISE
jgi:hypothetical protein